MQFHKEIWEKMFAQTIKPQIEQLRSMALRVGFKAKKGEVTFPYSMVEEIVKEAYISGASAALKMAADVDGEAR